MDISGMEEFAEELDDFADSLSRMDDEIDSAVHEGVRKTAEDNVVPDARRRAPEVTGRLRASIGAAELGPGEYIVYAATDYAIYVHDGTDPHIIKPRYSDALRFTVGGRVVYATEVTHPGNDPNPFLEDAVQSADLVGNIKEELDKVFDNL